ncbi:hypothetical protein HK096_001413, partial [Nowakowskiella sp. JEL0078]
MSMDKARIVPFLASKGSSPEPILPGNWKKTYKRYQEESKLKEKYKSEEIKDATTKRLSVQDFVAMKTDIVVDFKKDHLRIAENAIPSSQISELFPEELRKVIEENGVEDFAPEMSGMVISTPKELVSSSSFAAPYYNYNLNSSELQFALKEAPLVISMNNSNSLEKTVSAKEEEKTEMIRRILSLDNSNANLMR